MNGRDEHGRCEHGHRCCIDEAPGHGRPHIARPEDCEWCLALPTAAQGVTSDD
jgi:hypothetical protein